jgi:hypothetical protein
MHRLKMEAVRPSETLVSTDPNGVTAQKILRGIFPKHLIVLVRSGNAALNSTGDSHRGIKWPGREPDHSPASSAEVNNGWRYTSSFSNQ